MELKEILEHFFAKFIRITGWLSFETAEL